MKDFATALGCNHKRVDIASQDARWPTESWDLQSCLTASLPIFRPRHLFGSESIPTRTNVVTLTMLKTTLGQDGHCNPIGQHRHQAACFRPGCRGTYESLSRQCSRLAIRR